MRDAHVARDPEQAWWTIQGVAIKDALDRVAMGSHPELVWLELIADSELDRGIDEGDGR